MNTFRFFLGTSRAITLVLFCATGVCLFASRTALCQSSVQRDQQALSIVTQTIASVGGQQVLASIQDFTETGSVTFNGEDQVTGNVTVKGRGLHQFRLDADLPNGRHTTVVNGEGGSLREVDGKNRPILRQSAADLGSLTLPCLPLMAAVKDPSTSIVYGGLVTHDSASAYDVRLVKVYSKQQDPSGNQGEREAHDFYIDPETFHIVAVSDRIHSRSLNDKGIPHEILYSNYQPESGIIAPLKIEETVRGVVGVTITLNQVTLNSGLGDSDFVW